LVIFARGFPKINITKNYQQKLAVLTKIAQRISQIHRAVSSSVAKFRSISAGFSLLVVTMPEKYVDIMTEEAWPTRK
jgi:hypothetical protein